jgi:hypothetical protein
MEIRIDASDIRNLDEEIDKHLNVECEYGHDLFDENGRLTLNNYDYSLEPHTYLSIMCDMQEQIDELKAMINDLNSRLYNVEKNNER